MFASAILLLASPSAALLLNDLYLPLNSSEKAPAKKVKGKGGDADMIDETPCLLFGEDRPHVLSHNESSLPELLQRMSSHAQAPHLNFRRVPSMFMHFADLPDSQRMWGMRAGSDFTWKQQKRALRDAGRCGSGAC